MRNKLIFSIVFGIILLSFILPLTSAFFTREHLYWTAKGFEEVNSPITQFCKGKLDIILDGNTMADVPVLHYYDEEWKSYLSTHTKGIGYTECLQEAGTDPDLICLCYGVALHNIQDHYSHTEGGLTPKYLTSSFTPNFAGHMVIEQNYEDNFIKLKTEEEDPMISSNQLELYAQTILNSFLSSDIEQSSKYIKLANQVTGLQLESDIVVFSQGFKGEGFYDTVYGEEVTLPKNYFYIAYALLIGGFGLALLLLVLAIKYGRWTYGLLLIIPFLILGILGSIVLISYSQESVWKVVVGGLRVPTTLGLLTVTDEDVNYYDDIIQRQTKLFYETGELPFEDNTGFDYKDSSGRQIKGALMKAQTGFTYIVLPVISILLGIYVTLLFYLTFLRGKKKSKRK